VPNNKAKAIQMCKDYCEESVNCRSFIWTNFSSPGSTPSFQPLCSLTSAPYSSKYWIKDTDTTGAHSLATEVYTVTNFKFPNEILPNGFFELGCLGPWGIPLLSPSSNRTAVVVPCKKGECPNNGSKYYAHLFGTPTSIEFATLSITNQPVIHDGVTYTISCWVLGTAGLLNFYDGTYNATGVWQKISETTVLHYGDDITIEVELISPGHRQTAPFDWKINGCSVKPA
jgi:hypothetical protein